MLCANHTDFDSNVKKTDAKHNNPEVTTGNGSGAFVKSAVYSGIFESCSKHTAINSLISYPL